MYTYTYIYIYIYIYIYRGTFVSTAHVRQQCSATQHIQKRIALELFSNTLRCYTYVHQHHTLHEHESFHTRAFMRAHSRYLCVYICLCVHDCAC